MIKLWDAENGDIIHTFEGHSEGISDVAWSSNGEFLASASDDKTVRLWSLETVRTLDCSSRAIILRYLST